MNFPPKMTTTRNKHVEKAKFIAQTKSYLVGCREEKGGDLEWETKNYH